MLTEFRRTLQGLPDEAGVEAEHLAEVARRRLSLAKRLGNGYTRYGGAAGGLSPWLWQNLL